VNAIVISHTFTDFIIQPYSILRHWFFNNQSIWRHAKLMIGYTYFLYGILYLL